jgi:serine/threonine protein phosphatase PrpC
MCAEPPLGLFVVADGMGGYEGGEVASRLVVETMSDFFKRNVADCEATWAFGADRERSLFENMVGVALKTANRVVLSERKGVLAHMGSTVAALALRNGNAVIGHIGDSRVYRLRDGVLTQLTTDHSLYAELQAAGTPDLVPRSEFAYTNIITRAIGMTDARPDLRQERIAAGDVYLLCTDGLVEKLSDDDLARGLERPPSEASRVLVQQAYERGSRDNITAIVVRVLDE